MGPFPVEHRSPRRSRLPNDLSGDRAAGGLGPAGLAGTVLPPRPANVQRGARSRTPRRAEGQARARPARCAGSSPAAPPPPPGAMAPVPARVLPGRTVSAGGGAKGFGAAEYGAQSAPLLSGRSHFGESADKERAPTPPRQARATVPHTARATPPGSPHPYTRTPEHLAAPRRPPPAASCPPQPARAPASAARSHWPRL